MKKVVILESVRTPIGRVDGNLKDYPEYKLASVAMSELVKRSGVDASQIDEIIIGTARQSSKPSNCARYATLEAKLPLEVPGYTVQRQSASGMQALANGVWSIQSEDADLILAGGAESMSQLPLEIHNARFKFNENTRIVFDPTRAAEIGAQPASVYGEIDMEQISAQISKAYGLSEAELQSYAARSLERSSLNKPAGVMTLPVKSGKTFIDVDTDEPVLAQSVLAKPADAAAVMLLSSEEWAKEQDLTPIGEVLSIAASAGNPVKDGLIGSDAVKKALELANISIKDVDYFYVLELSAAQAVATRKELLKMGLDGDDADDKINPLGGSLGAGNTYGAAGAVLLHDLLMHLNDTGKNTGLALACAEGGQAMAMIVERRH